MMVGREDSMDEDIVSPPGGIIPHGISIKRSDNAKNFSVFEGVWPRIQCMHGRFYLYNDHWTKNEKQLETI